jgi:uncharacterized ferritin-like protein (DUF455 family)
LARVLDELAFVHRASAHILAGWNAKTEDLTVKRELARQAFEDLSQAQRLAGHVFALMRSQTHCSVVPSGLIEAMRAVDASSSTREMLVGLAGVAKRDLLVTYHRLIRELDPVLDANLCVLLPIGADGLARQLLWAERTVGDPASRALSYRFLEAFSHRGELVESVVWSPLDRVPNARRPAEAKRALPGSMRAIPLDSSRDPQGIGLMLHNLINGEYTTMELVSRSLYEHPDMPPAFHLHLARQAYDEARHAEAIERAASAFGVRYGDHPVYTLTYDGYYQFDACEPGSKRELLWRLLLRGTIDEGLALDDFEFQEKRREHLEQPALAQLFRYLCADEVFHVEAAFKWSRHLVGGDESRLLEERAQANAYVMSSFDERRRCFVEEYPEEAIAEVAQRRAATAAESAYPLPFGRDLNLTARKAAGCSELDLSQIVSFGYARSS